MRITSAPSIPLPRDHYITQFFLGDQTMQIYDKFQGFPLNSALFGLAITPVTLLVFFLYDDVDARVQLARSSSSPAVVGYRRWLEETGLGILLCSLNKNREHGLSEDAFPIGHGGFPMQWWKFAGGYIDWNISTGWLDFVLQAEDGTGLTCSVSNNITEMADSPRQVWC